MRRRTWTGPLGRRLRRDLREADFGRRRFRLRGGPARERLEDAGRAFVEGFNEAVAGPGGDRLAEALAQVPEEFRGFAVEGAGAGCALLDLVTLSGGRRLRGLLEGPGKDFPHPVHLGVGRAFAQAHVRTWRTLRAGDPVLRWTALDGAGFHQGFFHADRVVGEQAVEAGVRGVRRAVRDQGLGRALWFHECADPEGVALRVAEFPPGRRADLWAGVGLAATYIGGCDEDELAALAAASGTFRAHLAQGSAFAAAAHVRSGLTLPKHCEIGAPALTGASAGTVAGWADGQRSALGDATDIAAYQAWRAAVRRRWAEHAGRVTPAADASADPAGRLARAEAGATVGLSRSVDAADSVELPKFAVAAEPSPVADPEVSSLLCP